MICRGCRLPNPPAFRVGSAGLTAISLNVTVFQRPLARYARSTHRIIARSMPRLLAFRTIRIYYRCMTMMRKSALVRVLLSPMMGMRSRSGRVCLAGRLMRWATRLTMGRHRSYPIAGRLMAKRPTRWRAARLTNSLMLVCV